MVAQTCPHCTAKSDDVYEVLDNNIIHHMSACEGCGRPYFFAVIECDHCGHEAAIAKGEEFALPALRAADCPACQRPFVLIDDGEPQFP